MENASNKKRTAVVASAVAAALLLSGTFAWNMATDQTKLNEFQASDPGDYNVELNENFDPSDPWANKDVYVTNISDNPVIVRVRLEEFYDLLYRNGTEYNTPEGFTNRDADGSAIFTPSTLVGLTDQYDGHIYMVADSSTKLDSNVKLKCAQNVMTMAVWEAAGKPYADSNGNAYWVIDEDGWCYYTKALSATESTSYLLDDVDFVKSSFEEIYDSPYTLDYYINVRLQAMSADLADFGSDTDTAQWTNIGTNNDGRIIAGTENAYESTADQTISDSARALVLGIENPDKSVGKAVTSVEDLMTVLADPKTDKVSLTNDLTLPAGEQITVPDGATTKTINLNGKTLTAADGEAPIAIAEGKTLVVEGGKIEATANIAQVENSTLVLNNVQANTTAKRAILVGTNGNVEINGSTITGSEYGVAYAGGTATSAENPVVNIKDSTISGILPVGGMTVNATNSTFNTKKYFAIGSNNTSPAKEVKLTGCTIESPVIGVFKSDDSPLTMTNCKVKVNATNTGAVGICVRSGNVTLDNVDVIVDKGENTITNLHTDDEITGYYAAKSGFDEFGYNALQVVLNSYEDIKLTINGGSYSTNVDNAKSVFVCNGKTIHSGYTYSNTITVTGNPAFSPSFAFEDSYSYSNGNTTVTKN